MQSLARILFAFGAFFAAISIFFAAPASAQNTRTWVSGTGDNANPCSRTAPCLTFAGAIAKTNAGGEINCLDAGGYGAVVITKSITIDCTGTLGAILAASGTSGVFIDGAGINVVLRGLAINGSSPANPGPNAMTFVQGGSLTIIDSFIMNFTSTASATTGNGIGFFPNTPAELKVVNTVITNNRFGILVRPTSSGSANVALDRVTVANNTVEGLRVQTSSSSGPGAFAVVTNSAFTGNGTGVALVTPAGTNYAVAKLVNSTVSSNTGVGVLADGPTVRADVSGSTITNNGTGVSAINGSILLSYLDNLTDRNGVDGVFTGSVSKR